ncbi:putative reverse transcriptase domain-containing protein [Tanacetum coccineum]
MSNSEDFTVTYTKVLLQASPSPDYVPGPKEPEQAPPLPNFVPEPVYLEFMPPEDELLLAEEQTLPAAASPTTDSPGYVHESDLEEDPEEEDDEDPEEDPVNYPADGGEEEEEHLAPAESTTAALPAVDHAPSAEETEPDESAKHTTTTSYHSGYARMSIRDEPPTPFWSEAEIARLLVHTIHLHQSSISHGHHHYLIFPHHHYQYHYQYLYHIYLPASPTYPLGYRVAMIQLRAEAPSTSHLLLLPSPIVLPRTRASVAMLRDATPSTYILAPRSEAPPSGTPLLLLPIPLPTPSPPLLPPSTDHLERIPRGLLTWPQKRLACLMVRRYEVGKKRDVGYGITDTWDEMLVGMPGEPATDETELGQWVIDLVMTVRQDTYEIYGRLDDTQTERQMVTSRVNMLVRYRRAHARTTRLMEIKARMSREAWGRSMDEWTRCTDGYGIAVQVVAKSRDREPARVPAQPDAPEEAARDAIRSTNGEDNHNSRTGVRRNETRPLVDGTFLKFMKCKLYTLKGNKGVVELTQWVEKMEIVFRIRNCYVENQIKFSICTLLGNALIWWNSHVRTVGNDVAYAMTWTELKKKMTDKYCSRTEIKKLEVELWVLKVKGTDVIGYNQCFQELALLYVRMFPEESDKIGRYVGGLPDMIHESVVDPSYGQCQEATVEIVTELMDKRIHTFDERQTKNKRKQDNNQQQQPQNKRQNSGRAYAVGTGEKKLYRGSKPLCPK